MNEDVDDDDNTQTAGFSSSKPDKKIVMMVFYRKVLKPLPIRSKKVVVSSKTRGGMVPKGKVVHKAAGCKRGSVKSNKSKKISKARDGDRDLAREQLEKVNIQKQQQSLMLESQSVKED